MPLNQSSPLGAAENQIGALELPFRRGERIVIHTDGLPEMKLAGGKLLGNRRIRNLFQEVRVASAAEARQKVAAGLKTPTGDASQDDDIRFVVVDHV